MSKSSANQPSATQPSAFDDLVGQAHITTILKSAVAASRTGVDSQEMTHAWIFTGPPGSGRSSAAIAFACALICPDNGCGTCNQCRSAKSGGHPDVEIIRTEGLSIKIDEVRELLTRVAWAPSMGGWRVVVMEDADRLTESAANALLKAIEEPGTRTVWLLCAPTLHDVLPTIRSRCRHLQLRTPSTQAVTDVLINRDKIAPAMADFAARVSQGHIGRAKYLATNESVRSNRATIMKLPLQLSSLAAAFAAAQKLVDLATLEANSSSEERDEQEIAKIIGADALVYQDIDAMQKSVSDLNPTLTHFDTSCFTGQYVTGDITPEYLARVGQNRSASQNGANGLLFNMGYAAEDN